MKPRVLMVGRTRLPATARPCRSRASSTRSGSGSSSACSLPRRAERRTGTRRSRSSAAPPLARARRAALLRDAAAPDRRELRRAPTDAILAQSPYEALAALAGRTLARSDAAVVVEIHGDWRTWSRLYGSPARALVAPLADRAALVAIRGADAVRTLSPFTTRIVREAGVEPAGTFTTYTELDSRSPSRQSRRCRRRPVALFVGVLERYKNVHAIAEAWRLAAPRVPVPCCASSATAATATSPSRSSATFLPRCAGIAGSRPRTSCSAFDDAWLLLLASRSEGTPRVVLEALCRGRAVVGARAGGIPDVVWPDETGVLVDPGQPAEIADALVRILSDRALAERLGEGARRRAGGVDVHGRRVRRQRARPRRPRDRGARPVRLVVVTQQVDPASAVLGATVDKLRALAERVDELVVLADSAVEGALPDNCRVRLFRSGLRAGRGLKFETALARELAGRPRPAAVLAHMCPVYAVLAAPLARPAGVKVMLWFTHWRRSRLLAHRNAALDHRPQRRQADLPALVAETRRDRSWDRHLRASPVSSGRSVDPSPCSSSAACRRRRDSRRSCARSAGSTAFVDRRRAGDDRRGAAPQDRARAPRDRPRPARPHRHPRAGAPSRRAGPLRRGRRAGQRHAARCHGQGRLRGGGRPACP